MKLISILLLIPNLVLSKEIKVGNKIKCLYDAIYS